MASDTYWLKQSASEPLFPDLLWSRPETKRAAGKLLIVGGQAQSFTVPAQAFEAAVKAGGGTVRVLLPASTQKALGKNFPEAEFGLSTRSGSFAKQALEQLLDLAKWADGVLLAGDFGKNSETAVLLENFMDKCDGQVTLAGDSLDYFIEADSPLVKRPATASVMELASLQKLSVIDVESHLVLHRMSLVELVEVLHEWTGRDAGILITEHSGHVIAAAGGKISTTPSDGAGMTKLAAYISVWRLQQPQKVFEAITSAIWQSQHSD